MLVLLVATVAALVGAAGAADTVGIAERLERQGRLPEAIAAYRQATAQAPGDPAAHAGLGAALSEAGQLPAAVQAFKAALKAGAQPVYGIQYNIGYAYLKGGRLQGAAKHFGRALKANPSFREGHIKAASVYRDLGNFERASSHMRQAIALEPRNPNAYNYLGGLLNNAKRWGEAIAAYRSGLALFPSGGGGGGGGDAEMRVALADTLSNLKRYTEAAAEYGGVIEVAEAARERRAARLRAGVADDPRWRERSGHGCGFFAPGQPGAGHCANPAARSQEGVTAMQACPVTCAEGGGGGGGGGPGAALPPPQRLGEALAGRLHAQASACDWQDFRHTLASLWGEVLSRGGCPNRWHVLLS
jgi:Tfp pilus assembly protein PilF